MSFGGGYQGGKTRMGTKVFLNVYDLSPMNQFLYPVGVGFHHSGVEILGSEYSFASGAGIFEAPPKYAPGAQFRQQIELGAFYGGNAELKKAISDLRDDFPPESYNLVRKNCNHFANALCWKLLRKTIPGFVNRISDIGNFCSCLLPRKMLESAPVGDPNAPASGDSSGFTMFRPPGAANMSRGSATNNSNSSTSAFSGRGSRLGSLDTGGSGGTNQGSSMWSSLSGGGGSNSKKDDGDDLVARREKARKAALARLEKKNVEMQKLNPSR